MIRWSKGRALDGANRCLLLFAHSRPQSLQKGFARAGEEAVFLPGDERRDFKGRVQRQEDEVRTLLVFQFIEAEKIGDSLPD